MTEYDQANLEMSDRSHRLRRDADASDSRSGTSWYFRLEHAQAMSDRFLVGPIAESFLMDEAAVASSSGACENSRGAKDHGVVAMFRGRNCARMGIEEEAIDASSGASDNRRTENAHAVLASS